MRVVLVTPGFPTSLDDHHKPFLLDHARALAAAGADVTVVCPAHPDAPCRHEVGDVEVRRVRFAPRRIEARVALGESYRVFSGLSALWVIPMIATLTVAAIGQARRRPDRTDRPIDPDGDDDVAPTDGAADSRAVVHGHWWFPCGLIAVAAAWMTRRHTASVVQIHGSDAAVTANTVHRWLARRVLRRADAVVAVSEDLRDWAASLVPRADGVPGGLPTWAARLLRRLQSPHSALSLERAGRRTGPGLQVVSMPVGIERLGPTTPLPADGPVLAVGRLMAEKGFDVLIEAVALMNRNERPDVVIVGDGPDRTLLEALALRRGVSAQFVGAVAPSEIGEWYQRARVVCVPSRREGFGMIVPEALAAGRPVVATAVGAAPHFITEGVNGYLVPPGDADALAKALAEALQSGKLSSDTAGTDAAAAFGPDAHAAALMEIYGQIVQP